MEGIKPYRLPAEWESQSAIQFTWPHEGMDWGTDLEAVRDRIYQCVSLIAEDQIVVIAGDNREEILDRLVDIPQDHLIVIEVDANDVWARDHGPVFIQKEEQLQLLDYQFNGWGNKFPSELDNQISRCLWEGGVFGEIERHEMALVLEGGGIESDGAGTIMTTRSCMTHPKRNPELSWQDLKQQFKEQLGAIRVLALTNGQLIGDDTDGHIDTLCRFCSPDTIAYVQCEDEQDEHFATLSKMKAELSTWRTLAGNLYQLIPLPLPTPCYHPVDGHRLPATYANFIIANRYVIVPTYQQEKDELALKQLAAVFPKRTVVGVDALPVIRQHGSLHCLCMHYPAGALNQER